jgi:nitrite reductase (NADH) small subunit
MWVRVAGVSEVPENGMGHRVIVEGLELALFQWDQTFYAVENLCPHLGFPLTEGIVQNGVVICGWHGWRISLQDGSCAGKTLSAPTFPCEVRGTDLYVEVPSLPDVG